MTDGTNRRNHCRDARLGCFLTDTALCVQTYELFISYLNLYDPEFNLSDILVKKKEKVIA